MGSPEEVVDSRATLRLDLSEDTGEFVERTTLSHSTGVEREGTDLAGIVPANVKPTFSQPKAGASGVGLQSSSSFAFLERQEEKISVNDIDDLFQGLD